MLRAVFIGLMGLGLVSCGSTPAPVDSGDRNFTPIPKGGLALPDRTVFSQKDPRWASEMLGRTKGDTLGSDGCLVTAGTAFAKSPIIAPKRGFTMTLMNQRFSNA